MLDAVADSRPSHPALAKPALILAGCTLGILAAWVATLNGASAGWRVSLIAVFPAVVLLVYGIRKVAHAVRHVDVFSPLVAFPILYVAWFAIGSIDFVELPPSVQFGLFEPIPAYVLGYAALGLIAYLAGARLSRARSVTTEQSRIEFDWIENRFRLVVAGLSVLMVASYAYIVAGIGVIPALVADAGEVRLKIRNYGPAEAVLFTAAWSLIPMLMVYVWIRRPRRLLRMACYASVLFAAVLLLSLGGRSYLFVPLLATVVARHYCRQRFSVRRLLLVGVLAFCGLSLYGYVRDASLSGVASAGRELGTPGVVTAFTYSYLYIRYPVATLRDVISAIPSKVPYQMGSLTFGPFATFLPGHHEQSDMFFKDILGNDFVGAGQPATLLGPLYADGGIIGIIMGLFLFAQLIAYVYRRVNARPSIINLLLYAWLLQTLLFSLFANLFPYITTLWIPLFWIGLDRVMRRRPSTRLAAS